MLCSPTLLIFIGTLHASSQRWNTDLITFLLRWTMCLSPTNFRRWTPLLKLRMAVCLTTNKSPVFVIYIIRRKPSFVGNKDPGSEIYDDVIKWKHFPRYWPFVRGIHRWPISDKGQWRRALIFFFDLRLNKRFNKQWWDWWFEMQLRPLRRHFNGPNKC